MIPMMISLLFVSFAAVADTEGVAELSAENLEALISKKLNHWRQEGIGFSDYGRDESFDQESITIRDNPKVEKGLSGVSDIHDIQVLRKKLMGQYGITEKMVENWVQEQDAEKSFADIEGQGLHKKEMDLLSEMISLEAVLEMNSIKVDWELF